MDETTLRSCPGCHRLAAPEVRVCRACYTVFPQDNPQEDAKPFRSRVKLLGGLKYVSMLIAAAWAAWFFQLDTELDGSAGSNDPSMMAGIREHVVKVVNTTLGTESQPSGKVQITDDGRRATQPAVSRNGHCQIEQRVQNIGDEPIPSVALNVALLDASGRPLGQDASVSTAIDLPSASVRTVDFRVPCKLSVASVEISLPHEADSAPRTVALVGSMDAQQVTRPTSAISAQVALELPVPTFCPLPEKCKLEATLSTGGTSTFPFYRDPAEPDMLLSDDSLLIGHLLTDGTATIKAGINESGSEIQLTDRDLREKERPGVLARWIQKIL